MRRYTYDPQRAEPWRDYPILLVVPGRSRCCDQPRVLVLSMEGGFVRANCTGCNRNSDNGVNQAVFERLAEGLWVRCPECGGRMRADTGCDGSKNYGFACGHCALFIWLGDLLPRWEALDPRK